MRWWVLKSKLRFWRSTAWNRGYEAGLKVGRKDAGYAQGWIDGHADKSGNAEKNGLS